MLRPGVESEREIVRLQQSALRRHLLGQELRETAENLALLWLHEPLYRTVLPMDFDTVLDIVLVARQSDRNRLEALANAHDRPSCAEHILLVNRVVQDSLDD